MDFADIWSKTKIVLRPSLREVDERLVEESDLAGPVVFVFLLGGALRGNQTSLCLQGAVSLRAAHTPERLPRTSQRNFGEFRVSD